jgi:NitT/TauT family transport system substrate-binding protein
MNRSKRGTSRIVLGAAALAAALMMGATTASALTKVRLTLDWVPQGTHGPWFIAYYRGYFKDEGLDVTIDPGKGSADAARKLVAGTHDIGLPGINALIKFNAANPDKMIVSVLSMYEQPPFSIFTMKKSGITDPRQLVGKTLGAPVFDASYQLFPALAKAIGIDDKLVKRQNMDPRLREPMLIRGEVDAITGHLFSSMLNIKAAGVPESDVRYFLYGDYGMESYANGIAVAPAFLKAHPEAVRGFVRATYRGMRDTIKHPDWAIEATKKFEPLIDEKVEADRLRLGMQCCILTPTVKKEGYGDVDMARLQRSIDQAAYAYGIKSPPKATDMFDRSYLPPKSDRYVDR